ncbi:putative mitochondrial beta-ketoacyl-CoA synthase,beta-ketoacyl-coenzyme A [Leptomonas pyrrhocoris]|uniref:Elongation of fatty acids protein n=1 Tax=Leptomonas pyrrhocoris TaxID=157538 RepID=A0A0N0DTA9_LEPPY|nr:putative mitochondrial beta-ketoacyl-CoA synthase,beta-ketoacyl-coenzyme A [Leptomonas pyrrhocoris]XP_015655681.1 putative mitochondrial beta-ketoacyl-CoA synthase,beta-ketoacyl-coenzyme A [Leptomonas pyrrhocoris]KPA77241.1 putative mitochondrial beta-ketoacyl-CoA synthase,beta-ketoacyl-coenzyme A [Leptomonas pyrrhocoris]KPA77242.1 putative mitochondrial beta-ketoacyl-CoA synthase,beta-ketoacyl-coenzyme A [Leptomonas pyrrhocoris]|eukprot:XP_015655680.1 putative mitochondrial beta-ketoacyl-CoA synthase,beta-ketoacyl-coenzyme A [Leptomonas pyrrhocoris]
MQWIDSWGAANYDGYAYKAWLIYHTDYAIYIAGLYLALVFRAPPLVAKYVYGGEGVQRTGEKPAWPRCPWICWNLLLSAFSFYGASHVVPVLLHHVRRDGLRSTLCTLHPEEYYRGPTGMAMGLFALSKGAEFGDTVFLLLSGRRRLPFLQWFHPVTTFLYCWHAYAVGSGVLTVAAALNYSVHTVMYLYFAVAEVGLKSLVRSFAMYITLAQITQMAVGLLLIAFVTYEKYLDYAVGRPDADPAACAGTPWDAVRVQILIAAANLVPFTQLFLGAYVFKRPDAASTKA